MIQTIRKRQRKWIRHALRGEESHAKKETWSQGEKRNTKTDWMMTDG